MAPKKNKKKQQSNSARPFATTSVPSKLRSIEQNVENVERKLTSQLAEEEPSFVGSASPRVIIDETADQEFNYEDHKLSELVGKHSQKIKQNVTRYVDKTFGDKRLLRASPNSASALTTYLIHVEGVLGLNRGDKYDIERENKSETENKATIAERIFALARQEAEAAWSTRKRRRFNESEFGEQTSESALIQSWMLSKALVSLGFKKEKVERAIEEVVGYGRVGIASGNYKSSAVEHMISTTDLNEHLVKELIDYLVVMEMEEIELPPYVAETAGAKKEESQSILEGQDEEASVNDDTKTQISSERPSSFALEISTPPYQETFFADTARPLTPLPAPSDIEPTPSESPSILGPWPALEPRNTEQPPSFEESELIGMTVLPEPDENEVRIKENNVVEEILGNIDDISPEDLMPSWVLLKKKLYILDPSSAAPPNPGKKRGGTVSSSPQTAPNLLMISRLRDAIMKMERDPLFDDSLAGNLWGEEKIKVDREKATKGERVSDRKKDGDKNQNGAGENKKKRTNMWWADRDQLAADASEVVDKPSVSAIASSSSGYSAADMDMDMDLIGSLFDAPALLPTEEQETTGEGRIITIRNFEEGLHTGPAGKHVGVKGAAKQQTGSALAASSVRKVLEEFVKTRDSSAKVTFTSLSGSTYSYRQCLTIKWSPKSSVPSTIFCPSTSYPASIAEVLGLSVTSTPSLVKIEMTSLAAHTSLQAEAYVSLYALFVLTGGCNGKGQIRVQGVWRHVWVEFVEKEEAAEEKFEKESLREVKKLIFTDEDQRGESPRFGDKVESNRRGKLKKENNLDENADTGKITVNGGREAAAESERLKQQWEIRMRSPKYLEMLEHRKNLPIWTFKQDVLAALEREQVVIICGETGCGKSTQVPAFILENELSHGRPCKVYCAEPRRISAISLARRVSEELGEQKNELGGWNSLVGYSIRLESCIGPQARLVYATTGIVMRMLEGTPDLEGITHLLLDEVHERSIDSDFLLIVLKKILMKRKDLKVVLMSATVDAERFSKYLDDASILNVPGRNYPVETKYLEDAIELTKYIAEEPDPFGKGRNTAVYEDWGDFDEEDDEDSPTHRAAGAAPIFLAGYSKETRKSLSKLDLYQIHYDLIIKVIETIAIQPQYEFYSKAILIFLPGINEIRRLNDHLLGHPIFGGSVSSKSRSKRQWLIYPLHSSIASEDQEAAFLVPPPGVRKIVLATNIAETGITIPDITCVIDTGKHKEMRFDERRQMSRLIPTFISRANAKQRRGRAGRVQSGLCFHLFTKDMYDTKMNDQQIPEMMRLSLQSLVLRVKICNMGDIEETLSLALDPPTQKNIRRAIDSLIEVKALTSNEELTALGRQLAKLPLDVYLGKLVLFGCIYKCLDAAITIAALLSSKSPFASPMGFKKEADAARLSFKTGDSDLLTDYAAYCSWRRVCQATNPNMTEHDFCRKNYLSSRTLWSIEDLKGQLMAALVDAGYVYLNLQQRIDFNRLRFQSQSQYYRRKYSFFISPDTVNAYSENENVVNAIVSAAFYPKLLAKDGRGWKNVASSQHIKLHLTSVNRVDCPAKWLTYYSVMQQSAAKFYEAHSTTYTDDLVIALLCGDADFRLYAGVEIIDGYRIRFTFKSWKSMMAVRILRSRIRKITNGILSSGGNLAATGGNVTMNMNTNAESWMEIFKEIVVNRKRLEVKKRDFVILPDRKGMNNIRTQR